MKIFVIIIFSIIFNNAVNGQTSGNNYFDKKDVIDDISTAREKADKLVILYYTEEIFENYISLDSSNSFYDNKSKPFYYSFAMCKNYLPIKPERYYFCYNINFPFFARYDLQPFISFSIENREINSTQGLAVELNLTDTNFITPDSAKKIAIALTLADSLNNRTSINSRYNNHANWTVSIEWYIDRHYPFNYLLNISEKILDSDSYLQAIENGYFCYNVKYNPSKSDSELVLGDIHYTYHEYTPEIKIDLKTGEKIK